MGTFSFPAPILFVGSSSVVLEKESAVSVIQSFNTNYLNDPWFLLNPSDTIDDCLYSDSTPLLSAIEITYQAIQHDTTDIDPPQEEEEDPLIQPIWVVNSFASCDCLKMVLPSDEAILEAQIGPEKPWECWNNQVY